MPEKEILSILAILLTLVAYSFYIHSIIKNQTKPHIFSWVVWLMTTSVVFFAQVADGGGVGTWAIGLSGVINLGIVLLSYIKKTDESISQTDWLFFILALSSLPFWYLTDNPLWAVVILTVVDVFGLLPTLRRTYTSLFDAKLVIFASLMVLRNSLVIIALEHYSLTTVLFPFVISLSWLLVILTSIYRKYTVSN